MTPPSAQSERAAPRAAAPMPPRAAEESKTAAPRAQAAPPALRAVPTPAPVDWNAYLSSRAEAMARAKSRRRRSCAMLVIIVVLVTAFGPACEYAGEKLPPGMFPGLFVDSATYFKTVPRRISNFFSPAGDRFEIPGTPAPLASAYDANPNFSVMSLKSSAAILANSDTGNVLVKKNANMRAYPASLTKIMTALLAIEHLDTLPETIVIDPAFLQPLYEANSTMAGFIAGEDVRTIDLIYGALLLSGGECGVALARAIAGSEADFAVMMNARAAELGMLDTHFTNATGLHDSEHYSTVRDIAKLLLHALENAEFERIFTTELYTTSATAFHEEGLEMQSNLFARIRTAEFEGGRILGGKTGWTGQAGQCLASLAEKNGNRYIFVSTGNDVEADGTAYNFEDALNAYENGILSARTPN
jgi:D-alanyl-D-alanine carboxypeptidase (penicillin-binding protein 5/6)